MQSVLLATYITCTTLLQNINDISPINMVSYTTGLYKPQITQKISYSPANVLCSETLIFQFQGVTEQSEVCVTVL